MLGGLRFMSDWMAISDRGWLWDQGRQLLAQEESQSGDFSRVQTPNAHGPLLPLAVAQTRHGPIPAAIKAWQASIELPE